MRPRCSPTVFSRRVVLLPPHEAVCSDSEREETSAGSVCIAVCPSETVASPFCEMTQSTLLLAV